MTTVFGKGLRGRRKAADDEGEVAQIADAANLWWTRRDFVQHPAVRGMRVTEPGGAPTAEPAGAPTAPPAAAPHAAPAAAPHAARPAGAAPTAPPTAARRPEAEPLDGRSFSEVFTTESLFAGPADDPRPAARAGAARPTAARSAPPRPGTPGPTGPRAATARPTRPAAPPPASSGPATPPPAAAPTAPTGRKPLPANHPLIGALERLGLGRDASWSAIQQSYRALAKVSHPDHTGDNGETMATLNQAYTSLRQARAYGLFDEG